MDNFGSTIDNSSERESGPLQTSFLNMDELMEGTVSNEEEESTPNFPTVSDSRVMSSMRVNAILGATCIFVFGILNAYFKMYRIRLSIRRVTVKPPELPKRGWSILWMWLWRTLTVSDEQFLSTSGLDALMFVKTFGLGIQLFLPLAIIGVAVLIPIHKDQHYDQYEDEYEHEDEDNNKLVKMNNTFLSMTVSNVKPKSSVFWVHFVCVYAYILYALLLLHLHQKHFIRLRHRYLSAHSSQNMWGVDQTEQHECTLNLHSSIDNWSNAICNWFSNTLNVLLEDTKEESSTAGAMSMLASRNKFNRLTVIESFNRTNSVIQPSSTRSHKTISFFERNPSKDLDGIPYRRCRTNTEDQGLKQEEDEFRFNISNSQTSAEIEPSSWRGSLEASQSTQLEESIFKFAPPLQSILNQEETPPSRINDENTDSLSVLKWWMLTDNETEVYASAASKVKRPGVVLSRPSVRFLKTVMATDVEPPHSQIPVCAQLYCALLTNFPRITLDEHSERTQFSQWLTKGYHLCFGKVMELAHWHQSRNRNKERALEEARKPMVSGWARIRETVKEGKLIDLEEHVISDTFRTFFDHEFVRAVPIRNHKELDLLLMEWDRSMGILERYEYRNSRSNKRKRILFRKWWSIFFCYCYGLIESVDAVDYYRNKVKSLEWQIRQMQTKVNRQPHANSWMIIFKTQKAASIASQVLLHTEKGNQFRVGPAPGPDEMNWQALWKSKGEKEFRQIIVIPFIVLLCSFPLGIFAGALSQLSEFLCAHPENCMHWKQYCDEPSYHNLITAWLPALIVSIWQNIMMPNGLYYLVQASCGCTSLSRFERRIGHLFFLWNAGNIFLGAMLGGSVLYNINDAVKKPQNLMELLGTAVPASSNFFVNYMTLRAFFLLPYSLLVPHPGIWYYLCILGGLLGFANTPRDRALLWAPRSVRYGREYGNLLFIFLISIAYSVIAPIILPITLVYFMLAWLIWRYQMLYVFVRKYESGGCMWPSMVTRLVFILWIFQAFTSCVFLTKKAYWQAAILWITVPIILKRFKQHCTDRFRPRLFNIPLEMTHHSPPADIDALVYTPPALHDKCAGWHPEYMKAWEGWRSPAYTI
eukprot:g5482.t1